MEAALAGAVPMKRHRGDLTQLLPRAAKRRLFLTDADRRAREKAITSDGVWIESLDMNTLSAFALVLLRIAYPSHRIPQCLSTSTVRSDLNHYG